MRMERVEQDPASQDFLLKEGQLGITRTMLVDDILKVTYTPYFPFQNEEETLTRNLVFQPSKDTHLIVALDVFLPQGQGNITDHYSSLFKQLEAWVAKGNKVTLIPYAASINLGRQQQLTFPKVKEEPARFVRFTPQYAMRNNPRKISIGQLPEKELWTGCISLKKRCDFKNASPFIYPSTFGKRPERYRNQLHQGLIITGANNWTKATIREDYQKWGAHVQGPNIGCPPEFISTSDKDEFKVYLAALPTLRRGGSLLPLAIDYALHLLNDYEGQKALLITKLTDDMCYLFEGFDRAGATDYPKGESLDVLGCRDTPFAMLEATKEDLSHFKAAGGIVAGFFGEASHEYKELVEEKYRVARGQEKKLFRFFSS